MGRHLEITFVILMCASFAHSQCNPSLCLCDAPDVDRDSVEIIFSVTRVGEDGWRLDVNLTWQPPTDSDYDYAVQLTAFDGGSLRCDETIPNIQFPTFACPRKSQQQIEMAEFYYVENIPFGHRLLFDISVYNVSTNSLARYSICINDLYAPDCYEKTLDEEYCRNQPILVSGKPVNASLYAFSPERHSDRNDTITATIVWNDPIQLNGILMGYILRLSDGNTNELISQVIMEAFENGTYQRSIMDLEPEQNYSILILPVVWVTELEISSTSEVFFTTPPLSFFPTRPPTTTSPLVHVTSPPGPFPTTIIIIVASLVSVFGILLIVVIGTVVLKRCRSDHHVDDSTNRHARPWMHETTF